MDPRHAHLDDELDELVAFVAAAIRRTRPRRFLFGIRGTLPPDARAGYVYGIRQILNDSEAGKVSDELRRRGIP